MSSRAGRINRSSDPSGRALFAVAEVEPAEVARRLPLGAIVDGRIVRSFGGGRYLLGLAGLRLVAEAPDGLEEGVVLRLRVRAHAPRLHLERLPDADEAIDAALRRAGLPADSATRAIVRALAARGLPIDAAGVGDLRGLVDAGASAETAAHLRARGLPLDVEIARLLDTVRARGGVAPAVRAAADAFAEAARAAGRPDLAEALDRAIGLRLAGLGASGGDAVRALARGHPARLEAHLLRGEVPARDSPAAFRALLVEVSRGEGAIATAARDLADALDAAALLGEGSSLPFIVADGDGRRGAEARFGPGEGQAETVAFDLETSALGRFRAFLIVGGWEASFAAVAETADARDHLRAGLDDLRAAFGRIGLALVSASVDSAAPARPPPAPAIGFDVLA